jgi:hypothetical protein
MRQMTSEILSPTPRITEEDCIAEIFEPLKKGFGFRHIFLGYSGSGKTFCNVTITEKAKHDHRWRIVTDQKNRETPYRGAEIPSWDALAAVEKGDVAIIRGAQMTRSISDLIDFDELGRGVWNLSQYDEGVFLGVDELDDACEGERVWLKGPNAKRSAMRMLYKQGRTNRISLSACTQSVQEIPRSAISQSDTMGVFLQDKKDLGYYRTNRFLDEQEIELVSNLQEYDFLFIRRGKPSRVCRFGEK